MSAVASVVISVWLIHLMLSLPSSPSFAAWRATWIGFDLAELAAYLAAAWGAWRRRSMVIPALYASSVLLLCDAWFELTLSWNTHGWWGSVLLAVLLEIPTATVFAILGHRTSLAARAAVYASLGLPMSLALHRGLIPPPRVVVGPEHA
jgi:hypothetical protein